MKKKGKKELDLNGVTMVLSNQVKLDGVWTRMPVGYPKTEIKGTRASGAARNMCNKRGRG